MTSEPDATDPARSIDGAPGPGAGRRRATGFVLGIVVLMALFGPGLADHLRRASDPWTFSDDVRNNVFAFRRGEDGSLPDDLAARYARSSVSYGHRLLYLAASRWVDAGTVSKVLPYLLYAVLLAAVGVAAAGLGTPATTFATLALVLSSRVPLDVMTGGLMRCWGPPLTALTALALVRGHAGLVALVACLGAATSPTAGLLAGLALALLVLAVPATDRGQASSWGIRRRVATVAFTALLGLALLVPLALEMAPYGPGLGPDAVALYPELGPSGRYGADDRPPYPALVVALCDAFGRFLQGGGAAWVPALRSRLVAGDLYGAPTAPLVATVGLVAALSLAGLPGTLRHSSAARRLLCLLGAAMAAHVLAALLAPRLYVPQRYTFQAVPVVAALLVPLGVRQLARVTAGDAAALALTLFCLVTLGGRGGDVGFTVQIGADREIYEHLARLPASSTIAGWPAGIMDSVPYLCRRRAFLTFETHQAYHRRYADEMRRRMRALIDATFAVDPTPLATLRDRDGVTHLLVDLTHLGPEPPTYFAPFDAWTREAHGAMRRHPGGSEVARLAAGRAVFRRGSIVVLDLAPPGSGRR
ncbi:MAG: hypothetical protein HY815_18945 [Candidatus Riflebacteria bacterium]|nr:hypothetical protein [Candidatus Riflebacteria bacterium]